ncbi:arylesterase [Simiduia sp. 21SJ11W-1]|uniref:arylesterase n=1 Tax=Simiduia sp. 21SJ11W-1 TaxID=2909669 RepID=UPI00209DD2C6|nr:arylesterase [Simiduia sp. 21SJ11W-1]UTA46304.1 arylesterase [Simiduia sp. 21SJ11W-1]
MHFTLSDYLPSTRALLATLALLVATAAHATDTPHSQAKNKLLVLGDSLSAGYGLAVTEPGWVDLLDEALPATHIVNASISGDTLAGGLARLPQLLAMHKPRWLLIELGGNDGLRGHSLAAIRAQLTELITLGQAADAQVLVMEMRIPPNYGKRYTEKFTALFGEQAHVKGATLIPFFLEDIALQDGMMQGDGIHPTAAAQPLMRDQVLEYLAPLMQVAQDS